MDYGSPSLFIQDLKIAVGNNAKDLYNHIVVQIKTSHLGWTKSADTRGNEISSSCINFLYTYLTVYPYQWMACLEFFHICFDNSWLVGTLKQSRETEGTGGFERLF